MHTSAASASTQYRWERGLGEPGDYSHWWANVYCSCGGGGEAMTHLAMPTVERVGRRQSYHAAGSRRVHFSSAAAVTPVAAATLPFPFRPWISKRGA
ncbi:unnamed protein product [Hydatigera taeniaeformis]|uniref:LRRNT_2 domain-containing protein n=1 Tax=Hydatigena taeniaeformis TaxID=6205 RepID=A0A0R3WRC5_HYDTA|nr:unnamed protein product [Hydatigera taeniaeformis]